jgi:hypothetical protein
MLRLGIAVSIGLTTIGLFLAVVYGTGHKIVDSDSASSACLRTVQQWPPHKQRWALGLAEDALAAGGTGPEAGSCEAERLEWLRAEVGP